MKIVIFWNSTEAENLYKLTKESLDSIWISDFVELIRNDSLDYKKELNISKDSAFCVEEDTLEFKDMIFEWQIPPKLEMDSLIMSIIGWSPGSGCWDSCLTCGSGCWI